VYPLVNQFHEISCPFKACLAFKKSQNNYFMEKKFTFLFLLVLAAGLSKAQQLDVKHSPKQDINLSPVRNLVIHPKHNPVINPKFNWSINPVKNKTINPDNISAINPLGNANLNPLLNNELNPMFTINLSPRHYSWKGMYLFNADDEHTGYITVYSQDLLLEFDKESNWNFFYIKTSKGTFNRFNMDGKWTGEYICSDGMVGYNLFDKGGEFTGTHIK
jgi:hypothetical protein